MSQKKPTTPAMNEPPIVLVCDAPVQGYDEPFVGPVGDRLASLMDLPRARLSDAFDLVSVFDRRPIMDRPVPMHVARLVCRQMAPQLQGRNVLFYGRSVCMAFGFEPKMPLHWQGGSYNTKTVHFAFAVIPDFDPRSDPDWSAWWTAPEHINATADFLRPLVHPKARA